MAIPNPNPNIEDGIKCDNKTWSSNKINDAIGSASGGGVPTPEAADEGKVLSVNSEGEYTLTAPLQMIVLSTDLAAGETEVSILDPLITPDCLIDVYVSIDGVEPSSMLITLGTVTLTFEEQASDMEVYIRFFK